MKGETHGPGIRGFLWLAAAVLLPVSALAQPVELFPARDNTLYEDAGGAFSNGSGTFLFAGRTAQGQSRRALLAFDVAGALPAGARLDSVVLRLNVSNARGGSHPMRLHRVLAAWGEGPSDAGTPGGQGTAAATGDATWVHTFFDGERWQRAGGDFAPDPSAERAVDGTGSYTWGPSAGMLDDVRAWLDDPAANHGWIVLGTEVAEQTAKRFDSREHPTPANRPVLTLYYSTSTARAPEAEVPGNVRLLAAYPNPFTTATTLAYELSAPRHVRLEVFDVLARRVAVLVDGWQPAGRHDVRFEAATLPAGLFFYRLDAGGERVQGRVARAR